MVRDSILPGAVNVDQIEIKIASVFRVGLIGSEDGRLAIRQEERSKIGRSIMRYLLFVFTVNIHNPYLQVAGTNQPLGQKSFIVRNFLWRLGMLRAIDNFLAVIRQEWSAVIAKFMRQLPDVATVGIHGVNIQIAVAR